MHCVKNILIFQPRVLRTRKDELRIVKKDEYDHPSAKVLIRFMASGFRLFSFVVRSFSNPIHELEILFSPRTSWNSVHKCRIRLLELRNQ